MYRHVIREQVVYGHFADYFAIAQEILAYYESKGWAKYTIYTPAVGVGNDVVYSGEYESLADFEGEMAAVMSDAGFMALMRSQAGHLVQGSTVSEILMTIDDIV